MNFLRCSSGPSRCSIFLGLIAVTLATAESHPQSNSSSPAPHDPSDKAISRYLVSRDSEQRPADTDQQELSAPLIVEKIMAANSRRAAELRAFEGKRWYHLEYRGLFGGKEASMEVLAAYTAPDQHTFSVISQSGSKLLLNRVLLKLLDSEKEAFKSAKQVELNSQNYKFTLLGSERAPAGNTCYLLSVKPRKENKFLYSGRIWVDDHDFAVVRMQGEPAKSPSFWLKDTQIDSSWEKVGSFWFIAHNHSVSHIRMGGTATLNIDYGEYQINEVSRRGVKSRTPAAVLPDPASVTPQR